MPDFIDIDSCVSTNFLNLENSFYNYINIEYCCFVTTGVFYYNDYQSYVFDRAQPCYTDTILTIKGVSIGVCPKFYNIEGKKTIVLGGAYSVDKYYRAFKAALYMPFYITSEEIDVLEKIVRAPKNAPYDSNLKKEADKIVKKIPANAMYWWNDEQPSRAIKKRCEEKLAFTMHFVYDTTDGNWITRKVSSIINEEVAIQMLNELTELQNTFPGR